jgi:hypothetical protein
MERNKFHLSGKSLEAISQENQDFQVKLRKKRRRVLANFKRILGPESIKILYESSNLKHLISDFIDTKSFLLNTLALTSPESPIEVIIESLSILSKCVKSPETAELILQSESSESLHILLNSDDPRLLTKATTLLINLSSAKKSNSWIFGLDVIERLVQLFQLFPGEVENNSLWSLCNLSNNNKSASNHLLSLNVVSFIIEKIKSNANLNEKYFELLSLLSKHVKNLDILAEIFKIASIILTDQLFLNKFECRTSACWMIFYVLRNQLQRIDFLQNSKFIYKVLTQAVLESSNSELIKAATYALSEISSGPTENTSRLIENNIFQVIEILISSNVAFLRSDGYFLLSNIAGGVSEQIKAFFDSRIFLESFKGINDVDPKVRYEAWHVFLNISKFRCSDFLLELYNKGFLEHVVHATQTENMIECIELALRFLENLVMAGECCGTNTVVDKIHEFELDEWISGFEDHRNITISTLATDILQSLKSEDED